jgi:Glycosyl transferase family 2
MSASPAADGLELSVVVPAFNEHPSLPDLHRRLTEVRKTIDGGTEIVDVDDGSSDESVEPITVGILGRHFARIDEEVRSRPLFMVDWVTRASNDLLA